MSDKSTTNKLGLGALTLAFVAFCHQLIFKPGIEMTGVRETLEVVSVNYIGMSLTLILLIGSAVLAIKSIKTWPSIIALVLDAFMFLSLLLTVLGALMVMSV